MYFIKSPFLLCKLYQRNEIWNIVTSDNAIYLTFDDGPVQDVTPWVLNTLEKFNAHATFFCVGENVMRNREILDNIIANGHTVGNHSYNHLNGWRSPVNEYIENVKKCDEIIPTNLFRPPYGRIKRSQLQELRMNYTLIFWSVLTGDFDTEISPEKCLNNAIANTRPGSIVVFHDSIKAFPNLHHALPAFLEHFTNMGYEFRALPYSIKSNKAAGAMLVNDYN